MEENIKRITVPFTQIANSVLNNKNISLKAKGLFSYVYSKPRGWNFCIKRIADDSKEGAEATASAVRELEGAGYLKRAKLKTGRKLWIISYNPIKK